MGEVCAFPGVAAASVAGVARPDMAEMFRDLAERAERGDLVAAVVVGVTSGGAVWTAVSTPENGVYLVLGGLEAAKRNVLDRMEDVTVAGYDFPEPA
ncbi:MAG: hypothetical protein IT337_12465 [Thermomicrobiales bacterium]|nr:hypothetical protein [Thermomicrobiales bacterium]